MGWLAYETPARAGVWPSGKATVFGTEDRRFESYHPSQAYPPNLRYETRRWIVPLFPKVVGM